MKAIAILAHHMDADGILGRESLARLAAAVHLEQQDPCDLFLTSGWAYRRDCAKKIGVVMAEQLINRFGVHKSKVVVDENARDTVGDAYFLRKNVVTPRGITNLSVVTSDYHVRRSEIIFKAILSPEVKVCSVGADVGLESDEKLLVREEKSLLAFRDTFAGIDMADDHAVCKTLSNKHPFYNGVIFEKLECS